MTMRIFSILWALTLSAFSAPNQARAEEPKASPSPSVEPDDNAILYLPSGGTDEAVASAASTRRECKPRYMAGPAVGIVAGPGAILSGLFMIAAGTPIDIFGPAERTGRDRALTAGGAFVLAAGTGALFYSIGKLVKNRRTRKRVCHDEQLAQLRRSR